MRIRFLLPAILFCAASIAHAADSNDLGFHARACGEGDAPACVLPHTWAPGEAEGHLGTHEIAAWRDGDTLLVAARREVGDVSLCCSIEAPMERIGEGVWGLAIRVQGIERAVIDIHVLPNTAAHAVLVFRGHDAPPEPEVAATLAGKLVEETIDSKAMGEPRNLTIYTPPGFDPTKRYPVVYLADGYFVRADAFIVEPLIVKGRLPPLVMIGLWPSTGPRPDMRGLEYLVGKNPRTSRFRAHEAFLIDEVMPFAEQRYGASTERDQRLIAGLSDGAGWAMATGAEHPNLFGHIAAFSFGWGPAMEHIGESGRPKLFISAGTLEPGFLRTSTMAATRARESGDEVVFEQWTSGHSPYIWQSMLIAALEWAFPPRK